MSIDIMPESNQYVTMTLAEYETLCKAQQECAVMTEKYNSLSERYKQLLSSWNFVMSSYKILKQNYNSLVGGGELGTVD